MPPGPGLAGQTQHPGMQPLFAAGRSLFSSQLAQQYPGAEGTRHPEAYHMGAYGLAPGGDPSSRHLQGTSGPAGYHQLHRPQHSQAELGMMGKAFGQHSAEPWAAGGLDELRGRTACVLGIWVLSELWWVFLGIYILLTLPLN